VVGSGILNVASRELRLSPVNLPINDAEGGFDGRDSAVLVRSRVRWIVALSRLSGVVPEKCDAMVRDLTFELRRSLDLHVHPLCRSTLSMMTLAIAPQFPLHSRPDENILRVCSILRPAIFDPTSLEKNRRCAQLCKKYALATLRRDDTPYQAQPGPRLSI